MRVRPLAALILLLLGSACAPTARPTVPPEVDLTGRWVGPWISIGSPDRGDVTLTLRQSDARVTGELTLSHTRLALDGPVEGTVSGRVLRFQQPRGSMQGELTLEGDRLKGTVYGGVLPRTFDLTRGP